MNKVAIVTDSTGYIPPALSNGYPIYVSPLTVLWGEESFRDGIDIKPEEFYEKLKTAKVMPSTSQVTPTAFFDLFSQLCNDGFDILCINISAKLSGTMDSAVQAKAMLPKCQIEIVDSRSAGMGMGFQVMAAARAAGQGATLQECKAIAEKAVGCSGILLIVDTLEFLHRGGRIGGAAAFLGTALNLKPILEVVDGKIEGVERVRTKSKAISRTIDLLETRIKQNPPLRLASLYTNNPEEARSMLDLACEHFGANAVSEAVYSPVSPVIGTHLGPGALGLCYMYGM
jgi:DegV family protein with EDD domain